MKNRTGNLQVTFQPCMESLTEKPLHSTHTGLSDIGSPLISINGATVDVELTARPRTSRYGELPLAPCLVPPPLPRLSLPPQLALGMPERRKGKVRAQRLIQRKPVAQLHRLHDATSHRRCCPLAHAISDRRLQCANADVEEQLVGARAKSSS
jgi:hypothetical protein